MTIDMLIRELGLIAAAGRKKTMAKTEISGCYAGDVPTYALRGIKKDEIWITALANENAAAVALAAQAACIVLTDGIKPDSELIRACRKNDIPLLLSGNSAYKTACMVYEANKRHEFDRKYKSMNKYTVLNVYISGSLLCKLK